AQDGKVNNTVAYMPGRKQLLTSALRLGGGDKPIAPQLRRWNIDDLKPKSDGAVSYTQDDGFPLFWTRSLALVSSRPGNEPDYVALVVREQKFANRVKVEDKVKLKLVRIDPDHFGELTVSKSLWDFTSQLPMVTATPNGRYIAIGGDPSNSI